MSTWTKQSKNTSSWIDQTKNTASWIDQTKNTANWIDQTRNVSTYNGGKGYLLQENGDFLLAEDGTFINISYYFTETTDWTKKVKN